MVVKIGTLIKFKSRDELAKIPCGVVCDKVFYKYNDTQLDMYADKIAIIIEERDGEYEVYFPHNDSTHAWSYEEEFDAIEDLLADYRETTGEFNCIPPEEETEKPFITECRNIALEKNLPLYFVYYEETGVFEVYKTDTKELFEKRHCAKHLSAYEFQEIATRYLADYSDWSCGAE